MLRRFERLKPLLRKAGEKELSPLRNLIGGALAGIVSVSFTYPLDFVRARLTCQGSVVDGQYKGIRDALTSIARKEGIPAMYRGISPTLMGIAPYVGLNFSVFETLKVHAPKDESGKPDIFFLLGCGAVAGACGQTAAYPFDLLRRRFQMAAMGASIEYKGTWQGFRTIVRSEGVVGLYNLTQTMISSMAAMMSHLSHLLLLR